LGKTERRGDPEPRRRKSHEGQGRLKNRENRNRGRTEKMEEHTKNHRKM
jgi:hypothetical protein